MEVIQGHTLITRALPHAVVTIGNFDGFHLGHQAIARTAIEQARKRSGVAVAYTFRPHPQVALRPGAQVQLLSTYEEKLELLEKFGIDVVVEEPFSREFSTISAEQFFNDILLRRINAEAVVVGYDFAFGKERQGHLEALGELSSRSGVELTVTPPLKIDGEVVSSSRIRAHLLAGRIEQANALLGRQFGYRGVVIKGEGRGRKLGFPTANLKLDYKIALPYGVYATWAVRGENRFLSVTNIGVRPTFHDPSVKELPALVETHLLDQDVDLYGTSLEVRFVRQLRSERKFAGVDALKAQIALDAQEARRILEKS